MSPPQIRDASDNRNSGSSTQWQNQNWDVIDLLRYASPVAGVAASMAAGALAGNNNRAEAAVVGAGAATAAALAGTGHFEAAGIVAGATALAVAAARWRANGELAAESTDGLGTLIGGAAAAAAIEAARQARRRRGGGGGGGSQPGGSGRDNGDTPAPPSPRPPGDAPPPSRPGEQPSPPRQRPRNSDWADLHGPGDGTVARPRPPQGMHYHVDPNTGDIVLNNDIQTMEFRPNGRDAWMTGDWHYGVDPNTGKIGLMPNTETMDYRPNGRDAWIANGRHFALDPQTGVVRRYPNTQTLEFTYDDIYRSIV